MPLTQHWLHPHTTWIETFMVEAPLEFQALLEIREVAQQAGSLTSIFCLCLINKEEFFGKSDVQCLGRK